VNTSAISNTEKLNPIEIDFPFNIESKSIIWLNPYIIRALVLITNYDMQYVIVL